MVFSIKTKIWNGSFLIFLLITMFSYGLFVVADDKDALTTYFDDPDQDGLSTEEEKALGTDPSNNDTDGDSYSDGVEVQSGYNPLVPAPGDRVVPEETPATTAPLPTTTPNTTTTTPATTTADAPTSSASSDGQQQNLTDITATTFDNLIREKQASSQQEITSDDLTAAVEKVMENANTDVELPAVDTSTMKIKKLPSNLSDEEKKTRQKVDTLEYLTTVSYIILSNMPTPIHSESDFLEFAKKQAKDMTVAFTTGNFQMLDDIERKANKIIEEIEQIEVPENMVATQTKAIKMVKLVSNFGTTVRTINPQSDPLGQMLQLSKLQGALFNAQNFFEETTKQMTQLGISTIPLDL